MRPNNLYMNFSKENSSTVLFHLFSRHDHAASAYRQIVADLQEDDPLRDWFGSLADFRQSLADELRTLVEDSGEIPVRPSQEMKSYLHGREEEIIRLINEAHTTGLIDLSLEAEESVAKYYQEAEANKEIPQEIRQQLEKQHGRLLEVIRKAERLHTVPEQDRAGFKV